MIDIYIYIYERTKQQQKTVANWWLNSKNNPKSMYSAPRLCLFQTMPMHIMRVHFSWMQLIVWFTIWIQM